MCHPLRRMRGGGRAAIAAGQRALERRLGKTFARLVRQYIRLELKRLAQRRRQIFSPSTRRARRPRTEVPRERAVRSVTTGASAAEKVKGDKRRRDERRIQQNDARTFEQTKAKSNSKEIIRTTESRTSNPDNNFEEPNENEQQSGEVVFTDGRQATSTAGHPDTSLRTVVVRLERQDLRLEMIRLRRQRRLTITGTPHNFSPSNREPENFDRSSPAADDSDSDVEEIIPLQPEIQEEQDVSETQRTNTRRTDLTSNREPENFDKNSPAADDSDSDVEEIIHLQVFKPEIQEEQDESETQRTTKQRSELTSISPAFSPILDDDIEPEEEHPSNGLSNVRVTVMTDYHKQDFKPENFDRNSPAADDSDSDVEEILPLQPELQKDQDVSETQRSKKRRTGLTPRASAANKLKRDSRLRDERRIEQNDSIRGEQTKKRKSNSRIIQTTQKRTSKSDTNFKESHKYIQQSVSAEKREKQHTRPKSGREVKCDLCERSFNRKGLLMNHRRIHTGEKPYKCRVCKRSFTEKGGLTKHNVIHTGEKPYKCDVCDRRFRFHNTLRRHYRAHANLRPFTCDTCDRSFSEKGNLIKHFRKHTGEKPFKCRVCKHRFTEKGNLTKHMAKGHQINARKIKCSIKTVRAQKENRPSSH